MFACLLGLFPTLVPHYPSLSRYGRFPWGQGLEFDHSSMQMMKSVPVMRRLSLAFATPLPRVRRPRCTRLSTSRSTLLTLILNLSSDQSGLALVSSFPAANVPPEQCTFAQPVPVHFHSNALTMPDNNKELIHIDFGRITPSIVACVAGVKRVGEGGIWARVVSRPNSLPLPFRTPATRATSIVAGTTSFKYDRFAM